MPRPRKRVRIELRKMAKGEELEFFKAALKVPLDKLDQYSQDEFKEAKLHFERALHADRVFFWRKYVASNSSAATANLELRLEPCPTCEADHVSLGELDSCVLTVVTSAMIQDLLHHLEQRFREHWPIVYPAFIEELRAMQTRLSQFDKERDDDDPEE